MVLKSKHKVGRLAQIWSWNLSLPCHLVTGIIYCDCLSITRYFQLVWGGGLLSYISGNGRVLRKPEPFSYRCSFMPGNSCGIYLTKVFQSILSCKGSRRRTGRYAPKWEVCSADLLGLIKGINRPVSIVRCIWASSCHGRCLVIYSTHWFYKRELSCISLPL